MIGSKLKRAVGANPFVGPRPFETGRKIFGRDREIDDLYYLLSAERIVLLHSPSGAGKSSLIQAGLIPRLNERFDVWGPTRVNLQPSADQSSSINRYVRSAVLGFEQQIPAERRRSEAQLAAMTLAEYVASRPRRRSAPQNIVLIFDQFEEILTADPLAIDAKHEFFRQLGELLLDPHIWALFALREDYLAPLDPYADQVPTHLKNSFRLDLLRRDAARDAITGTAAEGGREADPAAVDKLVRDLATMKVQQPDGTFVKQTGLYVEPLQLQVVCRGLWERMPEDDLRIDLEDIEKFGDVTDALSNYYSGEVGRIAGEDVRVERAIREWCGDRLITPNGIRGQVLRGAGQSEGLDNELIASLVNTHLVRGEQRAGAVWYELAHDRLIEPVRNNNRDWLDAHLHKVQKVATLWEAQGRPEGLLLLGEELIEAKQWAAQNESSLTAVEGKFLEASTAKQESIEKEQRQAKRLRRFAAAMVGLALLAIVATGVAYYSKRNADKERQRALSAEEIAKGEKHNAETQAEIARLEKLHAEEAAKKAEISRLEAEKQAEIARQQTQVATAATVEANKQFENAESIGYVANMSLANFEFASNNHRRGFELLDAYLPATNTGQKQKDQRSFYWYYLWLQNYRELATLSGHESSVNSVAFSPDGRTLASASGPRSIGDSPSRDNSIKLWDANCYRECKPLATLLGHKEAVWSVAFSPDKDKPLVASASVDNTIKLWDANCRKDCMPLATLTGHEALVRSVAFSPDGRTLASASNDKAIRLWDANCRKDCKPLATLNHEESVFSVAFSRDNRTLASSGDKGVVKLWDVNCRKDCKPLAMLTGHEGIVWSVAFSPDKKKLASASSDGTVKLWDVNCRKDCKPLATLSRNRYAVRSVAFSPDGRTIACASENNSTGSSLGSSVVLWDVQNQSRLAVLSIAQSSVSAVTFSPDGRTLAGASYQTSIFKSGGGYSLYGENSVKLWFTGNLMEPKEIYTGPLPFLSPSNSLSFSSNKKKPILAAAFSMMGVRRWDLSSGKELAPLTDNEGNVDSLALSPDGQILATRNSRLSKTIDRYGVGDNSIKLWDANCLKDCKPLAKINEHDKKITSVAFSPNKNKPLLASASSDGTIKLWDVNCRKDCIPLTTLTGHGGQVKSVAFSPDGETIASAAEDRAIWLWDANCRKDCKPLAKMSGHEGAINSIAFSTNKSKPLLASASWDKTIKLWDVNCRKDCKPLTTLTGHGNGVQSVAFSPDGRTLASAGADGLIKLWEMRSSKELATLNGGNVWSVAFSPDGRILASGGGGDRLRLWVAATDNEVEASQPRKK